MYVCMFGNQILLDNTDKLLSWFFWVSMTVTGVMGFAIGLVTVMQVFIAIPHVFALFSMYICIYVCIHMTASHACIHTY